MSNTTQEEIIATLDRIIAMQDKMIERLNEVNNMMKKMNDNISSNTSTTYETGPR
jgi:uncharacterized coiled-coil protein SlyX